MTEKGEEEQIITEDLIKQTEKGKKFKKLFRRHKSLSSSDEA